jgi:hypothetical protein
MLGWLLIIGVFVIGMFLLKFKHMGHRLTFLFFLVLFLFVAGTFAIVSTTHELDLKSPQGILDAGKIYMGWFANGFDNMKSLTGYAVKMDWTKSNVSTVTPKTNGSSKPSKK